MHCGLHHSRSLFAASACRVLDETPRNRSRSETPTAQHSPNPDRTSLPEVPRVQGRTGILSIPKEAWYLTVVVGSLSPWRKVCGFRSARTCLHGLSNLPIRG